MTYRVFLQQTAEDSYKATPLAFPDCVAYGFFPQRHQTLLDSAPLVHNADERIDLRDLGFAARCYADLAQALLGS